MEKEIAREERQREIGRGKGNFLKSVIKPIVNSVTEEWTTSIN